MFQTDYYSTMALNSHLPQHQQQSSYPQATYPSYHQAPTQQPQQQQQLPPQYQPHHAHRFSTNNFYDNKAPTALPMPTAPVPNPLDYGIQQQQQAAPAAAPAPPANDSNVTGGVSAVLDYDVDEIAKFLTLLSVSILKEYDTNQISNLESKLKNVITATRLPKSTILLSILYLSNKVASSKLDTTSNTNTATDIYTNVIISLLLANKFNDDSTFTNKSWSHASGLEIKYISTLEIEFLKFLKYDLKTIAEDASFKILENSFEDWCLNNKSQSQPQSQQVSPIQQQQESPVVGLQNSQFYPTSSSSPPPTYFSSNSGFSTPTSSLSGNGTAVAGGSKNYYNSSNTTTAYASSPIANPYVNQYYDNDAYTNEYYRLQRLQQQQQQAMYQQHQQYPMQQQQQQQAVAPQPFHYGYYYNANDQFVPCY